MIPVHLFGQPAAMDELLEVARRHRLRVIEDCAQAPGATYKRRKVGTLGDCGIFSFQETKNLMTGEGGMLITEDPTIADIARLLRNHGEAAVGPGEARSYKAEILGWNYRMTEFEAALVQHLEHGTSLRLSDHRIRRERPGTGLRTSDNGELTHGRLPKRLRCAVCISG